LPVPTSSKLLQTRFIDDNEEITTEGQQPMPIAEKLL